VSDSDPDTDRFAAVDPGPFRGPVTGSFTIPDPEPAEDTFDPFNTNTWNFKGPPTPWYRVGRSRLLLLLVAAAAAALVTALVLLATQNEPADNSPAGVPSSTTTATSTTATTTPTTTSVPAPPRPPPPPAPPPPAAEQPPPAAAPHPDHPVSRAKGPELNVTRLPMSVAPVLPRWRQ
jgi:hypothetical protein